MRMDSGSLRGTTRLAPEASWVLLWTLPGIDNPDADHKSKQKREVSMRKNSESSEPEEYDVVPYRV